VEVQGFQLMAVNLGPYWRFRINFLKYLSNLVLLIENNVSVHLERLPTFQYARRH
jgi:hypothetical protein